jgi:hypothetical protein
MTRSTPDDKEPDDLQTRVRQPSAPHTEIEPTRLISPAADAPAPARPRRRGLRLWLVAAGALAVFWWPPLNDEEPHSAPALQSRLPASEAHTDLPPAEPLSEPLSEKISEYRRRLLTLRVQPAPELAQSERQRQLTALFNGFTRALETGNIDLPATDSASEYLIRMTVLDPQHPQVLEARSMLARAFLERARGNRRWRSGSVPGRPGPNHRQINAH